MTDAEEATPTESELFDYEEMLALVDGDPDMGIMMLENFLESERGTLEKVQHEGRKAAGDAAMVATIDWPALRTSAHSLKGSSSYLCAKHLSSLALQMQRAAEARDLAVVNSLLPRMVSAFDASELLMRSKLTTLQGA